MSNRGQTKDFNAIPALIVSAGRQVPDQHSVRLTASPPKAVSLYLCDISRPVCFIASMQLSSEMKCSPLPRRARSAPEIELRCLISPPIALAVSRNSARNGDSILSARYWLASCSFVGLKPRARTKRHEPNGRVSPIFLDKANARSPWPPQCAGIARQRASQPSPGKSTVG